MSNFVQYTDNKGENILYTPSKKIGVSDIKSQYIKKLISKMENTMDNAGGIGLAANQVGEPLQLFMIKFESNIDRYKNLKMENVPLQIFINPKILKVSEEKIAFWHGCLSALDQPRGKVATYKWIGYEAFDEQGNFKSGRLSGMAAIIFQHEFRHLLGQCYMDFAKEFLTTEDFQKKIQSLEINAYEEASLHDPLLLSDYVVGDSIEEYAEKINYL